MGMVISFLAFGIAVAGLMVAGFRSKRAFLEQAIRQPSEDSVKQHRLAGREISQHT
jgi:hypothetical protein